MGLEKDDSYRGESMALAYDQIKGLVEAQKAHGAHIDSKSATMIAVATALVGIVVPLVLGQFEKGETFQYSRILLWAATIPVIAYLATVWFFVRVYWIKKYSDINDPDQITKIIDRTREAAYESLYRLVEEAYEDNKKVAEGKVENLKCLLLATLIQTLIIIVWSFLVAFFSFGA